MHQGVRNTGSRGRASQAAWVLLAALALAACAATPEREDAADAPVENGTPAAEQDAGAAPESAAPVSTPDAAALPADALPSGAKDTEHATVPEVTLSTPSTDPAPPTRKEMRESESTPGQTQISPNEALPSSAPEMPGPPTRRQLCARLESEEANVVDDMQVVMEETTCTAALWLDGLFGETPNVRSARRTSGYFETSARSSEFEGDDTRVRFRVRLRLPNLKNRVSAVFGRDNEDDLVRDRTEAFAVRSQLPKVDDDDSWLTGLGYSFPGSDKFKLDSRIGVSGLAHPRLYVQQRARYIVYSDEKDLVYARGTGFWTNRQGFGTTAGIDYTRVLTQTLLLRVAELGTISEKTEGLDWFSGLILYQNLREERGMAYELLARGQTDEPEPLYEYGARIVYRHPFLPRRLYGELLVGYSWPRLDPDLDREGSAQVGVSLEVPFGQREE